MPLSRTGFETQLEDICAGAPAFGSAAVLPWDTEIFGFPVATYRVGVGDSPPEEARGALVASFHLWMTRHDVRVCSCSIPAESLRWKAFIPELGFRFVDFAMDAFAALSSAALPRARAVPRLAEPGDRESITELAENSFAHGRYFADSLFSQELAQSGTGDGLPTRCALKTVTTTSTCLVNPGA